MIQSQTGTLRRTRHMHGSEAIADRREGYQPTGEEHGVHRARFTNATNALCRQRQPHGDRIGVHVAVQATADEVHASKLLQHADSNVSQSDPKQPTYRIPLHDSQTCKEISCAIARFFALQCLLTKMQEHYTQTQPACFQWDPSTETPSALRGYTGTLDNGYLRSIPLPWVRRTQSRAPMTRTA